MLLLVLVGYNFIQFCVFRLSEILFDITTKHLFQKLHWCLILEKASDFPFAMLFFPSFIQFNRLRIS